MTDRGSWRKASFSITNTECVEVVGTLDAIRDSKAVSQVLAVRGFPQLLQHIKDDKLVR